MSIASLYVHVVLIVVGAVALWILYLFIKLKLDLRALQRRHEAEVAEIWRRHHAFVAELHRLAAEREAARKAHHNRWLAKFRAARTVGAPGYSQPPTDHYKE